MDAITFGDFPAARELVVLLDKQEDQKSAGHVRRLISNTIAGYVELDQLESDKWFKRFALMWHNERKMLAKESKFESEIETFTLNVLSTIYKQWRLRRTSP